MDSKKLAKIIKLIVEQELKRQIPVLKSLIKEEVTKELLKTKKISTKQIVEEIDPFSLASNMLDESRINSHQDEYEDIQPKSVNTKRLSSNPVLNEILNNTKPFREGPSLNENVNGMEEWPTMKFDKTIAPVGADGMREQMKVKMGYGDMNTQSTGKKPGLGVTTGLPYLDRVLNRDNSELVKQFKTRK